MVNEPPSSMFLAAPKKRLGLCKALESTPPLKTFPDEGATLLYALANQVKLRRLFYVQPSVWPFLLPFQQVERVWLKVRRK